MAQLRDVAQSASLLVKRLNIKKFRNPIVGPDPVKIIESNTNHFEPSCGTEVRHFKFKLTDPTSHFLSNSDVLIRDQAYS